MENNLRESVRAAIEQGRGEAASDLRFLPLVTLESGARVAVDAEARWILIPEGGAPTIIDEPNAHLYHEALEWKRSRFEESLAEAARSFGLPEDDAILAFPAVPLVRAVLGKRSSYLTRLALQWLLPSELRELRADILAVTRDPTMPGPIKDLAGRLVVAEAPPD